MPKKQKKTKEESYAEGYFPVDEDDLRYSIEKPVRERIPEEKEISIEDYKKDQEKEKEFDSIYVEKEFRKRPIEDIEKVEKKGRKKVRKKKTKKKKTSKRKTTKKKSSKIADYKAPNVKLKTNGYELVITEKPQAAAKIANALGKAVMKTKSKISYYEVNRNGHRIVVACAVGHLFTLKQNVNGSNVPIFDVKWIPNYLARKNDFTKRYYDLILSLVKDAGSVTIATDYDVEGEVIGLNVMRFICNQKNANRMKFSTLTPKELDKAYIEKTSSINWGQAIAGETRHYLDWFYGINLSRALMNAIKTTGKFRIMSIGRVQGPALNMIVKKEKEISKFEPEPYWNVFIKVDSKNKIDLKYFKDIFEKDFLKRFENLEGEDVDLETKSTEKITPPNVPFNLTALQTEAYKFHGITPANTLKAAQSLYLGGLISYPRTSSQELPESIDYKSILKKLANDYNVKHLIKRKTPIQGKKKDPAHPSIYPTGNSQILSGDEDKIYNLIVKRFLSLFCEDAIIANKRITAIPIKEDKKDLKFVLSGSSIKKKAWMEIYPSKLKEVEIPEIGNKGKILKLWTEEKETQPPKRYSQASIISQLEKKNLGTKSTRSSILDTLYNRNYVKEKSIEATPLGISLIETLEQYSPIIINEKLTRNFETEMEKIVSSKKDYTEKQEKIIKKAKDTIKKIANDFKKNESEIGKKILKANVEQREQEKIANKLCKCPKCKKGDLAITYSPKTKRFFIACDAYPDCKTTYSLPPNGVIKKTDKICEECGFPMLMRLSKGKRPWIFCFNPLCETNKEWASKRHEKQSESNIKESE